MSGTKPRRDLRFRLRCGTIAAACVVAALFPFSTFAAPPASSSPTSKVQPADSDAPNPETARLIQWVGSWALVERHFDSSGNVVASAKGQEDIIWILDKHAIRRSYGAGESGFRANGALAWNAATKRYEGMWFDNVTTNGPTRCRAEWNDESKTMSYTLESVSSDGKPAVHRSVERWLDDERRTATTFLVQGETLVKRLEVEYKRTTPCPAQQAGFRILNPELQERDGR